MSGFKDMVADDIMAVFLNLDDFGDTYRVEGKDIIIVVDNDELKKRQSGQDLSLIHI